MQLKSFSHLMHRIWQRAFRVRLFLLVHSFTTLLVAGGGWILLHQILDDVTHAETRQEMLQIISNSLNWGIFWIIIVVFFGGSFLAISIIRPIHDLTEKLQLLRSGKQLQPAYFPNLKDFDALNEIFSDIFKHWQHLFVNRVNEIVFMIDSKFHIIECSLSTEFFLGYHLEEIKKVTLQALFPQTAANQAFYEYLDREEMPTSPLEVFALHKSGYQIPLRVRIMFGKNRLSEYPVIACYPEEKIEGELQKRLEFSNQIISLGMMSNQIAHEIRNPLGAIKGMAQLLEEENDALLRAQYTSVIISESERLNQLIEKILLLSRSPKENVEPINIAQFLQERMDVLQISFPETPIQLSGHCNISLPLFAHELPHLFDNLILNALQHATSHTPVTIEIKPQIDKVEISIQNQGTTIPEEVRENLFRPFFSLRDHGNGLGLAIARKTALLHNGEITWKNTSNGVCFTVTLPYPPS